MKRRTEILRAKNRERQRIKPTGGGKEPASAMLKRPAILLDNEGEIYSVIAEPPSPRFMCCECRQEIAGQPYQFGGSLACEQCVTDYYRLSNQALSDVVPKGKLKKCLAKELAVELPWRAREGDRILREREKRKRRHAF